MKKWLNLSLVLVLCLSIMVGCASNNGNQANNGSNGNEGTQSNSTPAGNNAANAPKEADKPEEKKEPVELEFYYPVAVGGPITELVDKMTADFNASQSDYKVTAVYTGSYADTMVKVQTAVQGGNAPDMAVLSSTELFALLDMDAIIPLDELAGKEYLDDFYYGFLENGITEGKHYSIPFQRSTVILYYNKDAFREAGLDPEKAPANYDELVGYSKKLTTADRWGIEIPSTGYTHWLFQSFAIQNGKNVMNTDGTEVYFDTPENVESLKFWVSLAKEHKVMPEGTIEWGTTPTDFLSGKTAMMYHTTGNLAKVKSDATFDFGTAFLPAGSKGYGTPVGGGSFYILKTGDEDRYKGSMEYIKFVTEPERLAQWSIDTGYVAPRKSSYETEVMKQYVAEFPHALTARDQLEYAAASISLHNNGQVQKIFEDNLQAAIVGTLTPEEALNKAQEEATKVLEPFQK